MRARGRYYVDKAFSDTFLDNAFDARLNTFQRIRRPADVWEWGNTVLWPGLFGNAGPACLPRQPRCKSDAGANRLPRARSNQPESLAPGTAPARRARGRARRRASPQRSAVNNRGNKLGFRHLAPE